MRAGSPAAFGLVAAGGAVGGLLRYGLTLRWPDAETGFAWTTWAINGVGSFALAFLVLTVAHRGGPGWLRPALGTGLIGGFTTFSAVAHAADVTIRAGAAGGSVVYLLGSLAIGVVGAVVGSVLGTAVGGRRGPGRRASNGPEPVPGPR